MRKLIVTLAIGGAMLLGAMGQKAEAQNYPSVAGLTAFTPQANYMSLPGYLRLLHLQQNSRWISREEAINAARAQGVNVGPAPTG